VILFCDATKETNEKRYPRKLARRSYKILGSYKIFGPYKVPGPYTVSVGATMCRRNVGDLTARRLTRAAWAANKVASDKRDHSLVIRVTKAPLPHPMPLPPAAPGLVSIFSKTGMKRR
jgi:hypothetical protein